MRFHEGVGVFVPEGAVGGVVGGGDDAVTELIVFKFLAALVLTIPTGVDAAVVYVFSLVNGVDARRGCLADGVDLGDDRRSDGVGLLLDDSLVDLEALQDGSESGSLLRGAGCGH